jgi:NAD(P)H-hydrate epimerase
VVVILAGGGNNGAAGLVAARMLSNWGINAEPILADVQSESSLAVRRELHVLQVSGVVEPSDLEATEITLEDQLNRADLIIDALVGYGLAGPPVGISAAATDLAVNSRRPILALDVPTGVNAASGEVSVPAIRACTTLMLDLPKRGAVELSARPNVGEIYLADLGIPVSVHERMGIATTGLFNEGPLVRLKR